MPFHKLIKELLPKNSTNPKEKMISGCEISFPDTLFFENAAPSFLVQTDKDFCLTRWNEDKQLPNLNDLLQRLEKATKARKANKTHLWLQQQKQNRLDAIDRLRTAANRDLNLT